MLSPIECIGFKKCVTEAFGNKEFVENWERLRKRNLRGKKTLELFVKDVRNIIWDRLPVDARMGLCLGKKGETCK